MLNPFGSSQPDPYIDLKQKIQSAMKSAKVEEQIIDTVKKLIGSGVMDSQQDFG